MLCSIPFSTDHRCVGVEVTGPAAFTVALQGDVPDPVGIEVTETGLGSDHHSSTYKIYLPPGKGEVTVNLTDVARYRITLVHYPKEKPA
jgi:hypothetical protein